MRKLKNSVNDIILNIINNIDNGIIFCGSISDYYNFIKDDIDISDIISDVDIYANDKSIIIKLENIFKCEANLLDLPNEDAVTMTNKFKTEHYYMPINNTHIDIFLTNNDNNFNSIQTNVNNFNNKKIITIDKIDRYMQLTSTIDFWYKTAPMTKRLLKYLKKKMIYNKILDNET